MIRSYVALGDSFTEGMEDELGPTGRHRGWADRVAAGLALAQGSVRYANLAVRGRLLDQVVAEQLPVALRLAPDLASFHAGPNDVLRPRTDLTALLARYDAAVAALTGAGIRTVLFTVIERTGTGRTADRLATRFRLFNDGIRATAAAHGAVLVDLAAVPALGDRRLWHEDRLHLAPEGHARVAAAVLSALGVEQSQEWRTELPVSVRRSRRAELAADVRWVRVHLLPWIGRRLRGVSSGDGVTPKHPELVEIVAE
ncbi:MAG TPA: SGNH/GDSL hydrolase family protein [Mycobacteriales bacterium]|nr:SGNH/GDSL hydrolase family protein [Mycobacteriales bacterium]